MLPERRRPLGEMLVEAGIMTAQDLKVALEAQRQAPAPLGVTLVQLGIATEEQILPILAQQLNRVDVTLTPQKRKEGSHASVSDALQQLLGHAVEAGATDLHFEPVAAGVSVRIRIDGILREMEALPILQTQYPAMVSRIKIMCNLDIAEKRMPQDGSTNVQVGDRKLDLRISILPTRYGESVVIRILQGDLPIELENIGMDSTILQMLRSLLERRSGMILATGPTGSGKTTTLYACLNRLNNSTRKIVTVEDPIEYTLPGALQMQVNPAIDLTFSRFLRSVLRHDPNVIMVGEIRDLETAEVAIRMALTGHLVLSTLHTNDAASTITRFLEMGIEPYLVASSLSFTIAQRLTRTICSRCKGKKCVNCLGTGLRGRTGIFECLTIDEEIRKLILNRASANEILEKAVSRGMRTLYDDGLTKVAAGITTQEELDRVIHSDDL